MLHDSQQERSSFEIDAITSPCKLKAHITLESDAIPLARLSCFIPDFVSLWAETSSKLPSPLDITHPSADGSSAFPLTGSGIRLRGLRGANPLDLTILVSP